jgi:hypothetical protein
MDLEREIADHCEVQAGGLDLLGSKQSVFTWEFNTGAANAL